MTPVPKKKPIVKAIPSTPFHGFMATSVHLYSMATDIIDRPEQARTRAMNESSRAVLFILFMKWDKGDCFGVSDSFLQNYGKIS